MKIEYRINAVITGRIASQLNWKLNTINGEVRIINSEGRMVNGKSLLGLLSANIKNGDNIVVVIDNKDNEQPIKNIFNEIGRRCINGEICTEDESESRSSGDDN